MAKTFFRMVFRKFSEISKNKPIFSQYNIFYNYEYFFFSVCVLISFHRQSSLQAVAISTYFRKLNDYLK